LHIGLDIGDSYDDDLGRLLKEPQKDNRHDVWLWLYLNYEKQADFDPNTCNGFLMRDEIACYLKDRPQFIESLNSLKDRYLVHYRYLGWIEKRNTRQHQWLLPKIEEITDLRPGRGLPRGLTHLTGATHLIAMLDLWHLESEKKTLEIERLHNDWLRRKGKDSDYEWFADKKDGTKRCECAWEWLKKHHLSPVSRQLPISNYNELIMFFDQADLGRHEQKAMIQEIKKRWNRQQFDDRNADKKQCNVMLTKKVIDLLDRLGDTHGLKRAQVLERLITMESETGMYLDDA
jgi:hypothetical protein